MITINNDKLELFIEKMMEKCKVEDVTLQWGSWDKPDEQIDFSIDFLFVEKKAPSEDEDEEETVDHTISVDFELDDTDERTVTISTKFMSFQKTISFSPGKSFFDKCVKFAVDNMDNTLSKREEWNTFLWQYKLLTGQEYYDES